MATRAEHIDNLFAEIEDLLENTRRQIRNTRRRIYEEIARTEEPRKERTAANKRKHKLNDKARREGNGQPQRRDKEGNTPETDGNKEQPATQQPQENPELTPPEEETIIYMVIDAIGEAPESTRKPLPERIEKKDSPATENPEEETIGAGNPHTDGKPEEICQEPTEIPLNSFENLFDFPLSDPLEDLWGNILGGLGNN